MTLTAAEESIAASMQEYNESLPRKALGERTPNGFAHGIAAIDSCISNALSEAQKKRGVAEEGAEQHLVRLQRARIPMSQGREVFNFEGGPIGKGIHFQIPPSVLDRVEFGRVGGQEESR